MIVKLLNYSPLWLASNAIRFSHDNHDKSDTMKAKQEAMHQSVLDDNWNYDASNVIGEKDKALIHRVGNKMKHSSTLEMLNYVYDVEMSTKTLLAFSRHRVGVSLTMRSTRYTTSKRKGKHGIQGTERTMPYLERIMEIVDEAIETGMSDDECSLLLPQGYIYRGQIQFNGRSLQHFLELRTSKEAHYQIRGLAFDLFENLPNEHKYLYEECLR